MSSLWKKIGAASYQQLYVRNDGFEQMKIPIPEAFNYIDNYINKRTQSQKKGYMFKHANNETKYDTKNQLKPITFRSLHFIVHSLIYTLFECGYLTKNDFNDFDQMILPKKIDLEQMVLPHKINGFEYFKQHFLQDFRFIEDLISSSNDVYIWLFKMISNIEFVVDLKNPIENLLDLTKFETIFEEKVISPLILSVPTIIQKYKIEYLEANKQIEDENISNYISEVKQNPDKYPLLHYFSLLKTQSSCCGYQCRN